MVSPIIASLGAATLLLASCCFTSITGQDDYSNVGADAISNRIQPGSEYDTISNRIQSDAEIDAISNRIQNDAVSNRIQPVAKAAPPPPPPPQGTQGYVRRSNYSAPTSYNEKQKNGKPPKGSRSLNGGGMKTSSDSQKVGDGTSENITKKMMDEYLGVLGKHFTLMLEIAAKEIDRGMKHVAAHVEEHDDGGINVEAKTKMAKAVGLSSKKYLQQFFKKRWVGVLAHMAQEATDRFVSGTKTFFDKTDMKKLLE